MFKPAIFFAVCPIREQNVHLHPIDPLDPLFRRQDSYFPYENFKLINTYNITHQLSIPLILHISISYRYSYLLTLSSCSTASSQAALSRNNSLLWLRHSLCELSNSADRSSHFKRHSPTTLSNVFNFFSATATWPLILSNST